MSSQTLPAPGKELFHYLFAQASLGIAVEDLDGKILLANPVFAPCWDTGRTSCAACVVPTSPIPRIPQTTGLSFNSSVRVPSTGTRWKSAI